MAKATRQFWAQRIEEWAKSGLTRKQFAAQAGVSASTLGYWKWLLRAERKRSAIPRPKRAALAKRRVDSPSTGLPPLTFVEIGGAESREPWPIEIELLGGERVRVRNGVDAAALGRVLDLLGRRR